MRYRVQLWRTSTSKKSELEQVARGSSVDDAIGSVMKTFEWSYASRALALPVNKKLEDALPENWRQRVRCRISGEISYAKVGNWQDQLCIQQKLFY